MKPKNLPDKVSNTKTIRTNTLSDEVRVYGLESQLGVWFIIGFLLISLIWASFAQLSSAAIAPATLNVDGYRKIIQHYEGGIIKNIYVKEGDIVKANTVLIDLQDAQTDADFASWNQKYLLARAKEARLSAEYNNTKTIHFPSLLMDQKRNPIIRDALKREIDTFITNRDTFRSMQSALNSSIEDTSEKISHLSRQSSALKKQKKLIQQELNQYHNLSGRGLVTRTQIFSLQNQIADIDVQLSTVAIDSANVKQETNQLKIRLDELNNKRTSTTLADLNQTRQTLLEIEQALTKAKDKIKRLSIRSPIDGVIHKLQVHTLGGVITPGQALMDIVPESRKLVAEARIKPEDRESIIVGQNAEIRFTAFNQRVLPPIAAHVTLISADSIVDPTTREPYYKATIELTEDPGSILGSPIFPGMQAEVLISTGSRTALEYLLAPVTQSFHRAFRED